MLTHSNLAIVTFSLNSYLEIICILLTFKTDVFYIAIKHESNNKTSLGYAISLLLVNQNVFSESC